jgi:hypothetical protein
MHKKPHFLNFRFLLQLELLDVERFVELGNQILDVRNLLELLRAECLQAGRDDLVAAVVDVQLKLLQEEVYLEEHRPNFMKAVLKVSTVPVLKLRMIYCLENNTIYGTVPREETYC